MVSIAEALPMRAGRRSWRSALHPHLSPRQNDQPLSVAESGRRRGPPLTRTNIARGRQRTPVGGASDSGTDAALASPPSDPPRRARRSRYLAIGVAIAGLVVVTGILGLIRAERAAHAAV